MTTRDFDTALAGCLPEALRKALDAGLAKGVARAELLKRVRKATGGPRSPLGGLTYLAAKAYLSR